MNKAVKKPPYRVPSMTDIENLTPNGVKVISTFSGCGGSSLGYRMAGCTVLGANEFVPAAQDVYRLNASPSTVLWTDDVRNLTGQQMLTDVGLKEGELDILDGSPPCASFSKAGRGAAGWGEQRKYSDTRQRSDDLFFEYARLLAEMQPKAFIAENVQGLTQGVAKGYFQLIFKALENAGYNVKASVLDASLLGVPQARKRVIFHGIRKDLKTPSRFPKPLPYRYTLADVLHVQTAVDKPGRKTYRDHETGKDIGIDGHAIGPEWHKLKPGQTSEKYFQLTRPHINKPSPTITAAAGSVGAAGSTHPTEPRKFNLQELRLICSFPHDFKLTGTFEQRWERLGRSVPPVMMKHIAETVVQTLQESSS